SFEGGPRGGAGRASQLKAPMFSAAKRSSLSSVGFLASLNPGLRERINKHKEVNDIDQKHSTGGATRPGYVTNRSCMASVGTACQRLATSYCCATYGHRS